VLFRNDQLGGNHSVRFELKGMKSHRDAIGTTLEIFAGDLRQSRMVRGGSSYLSQSELPVTSGLAKRDKIDRVVINWPSGRTEEYKDLQAQRAYKCLEGKGIEPL
ncbi:MAG: ASPIC/UnbV domain-containing protein, partial [Acidobacteria bacterium Pan2503]|nr:ASPIC/UnbV domain-containing protein [Candidatus Acidoferrum panamensis]